MKIFDITGTESISDSIEIFKSNAKQPDIETYKNQYGISGHSVLDKKQRPDKYVKVDSEDHDSIEPNSTRVEKVGRLPLALQKKVVSTAVAFAFGNPVKLHAQPSGNNQKMILKGVENILDDNKIDSFNRRMCREVLRSTQFAEVWYAIPTDENHNEYGFESKFKLRVAPIAPWDGNELYPIFDATKNLIAFGRYYKFKELQSKLETEYFEAYTDEETVVWKREKDADWIVHKASIVNAIKKIPIVFAETESVDWEDVQYSIERLEWLLSNFADTNDYHAAPKIFVQGQLVGFAKKGESGAILEGEKGSTAEYLSWNHAPESVKLEIDSHLKFIYSLTQTPDISFESVKGLNQISGIALEMLFTDAHLKVQEKREVFDEYLQRRINLIKSFIGQMNVSLKSEVNNFRVKPVITPFTIQDKKELINNLMTANGGLPIISQKSSIYQSGLADDPEQEYKDVLEDSKKTMLESIFPPAN